MVASAIISGDTKPK